MGRLRGGGAWPASRWSMVDFAELSRRRPRRPVAQYPVSHTTRPAILQYQLQQTISRLTDECWDKCVSSPSTYFSGKENACLDNCAKRFMDTTQFVIKYYNSKNARGGGEGFDEFA